MNKPAKSGHRSKRRKQSAQSNRKAGHPTLEKGRTTKPSALRPATTKGRNKQHGQVEAISKVWERKQAQLESRWTAAQARQKSEEMARKRTMKIVGGATGVVVLAILLCVLALHYTGNIQIPGLPVADGA